jgi:FkbM family methyltransferase
VNVVELKTPGGNPVRFACRPETNDELLVRAVVGGDEYRLAGRSLEGLAIDIGAHIGSVAVALALDYPDLLVFALEPVPENFAMLCTNVAANGLDGRVVPLGRAAAEEPGSARVAYGFPGTHGFVGNEQADELASYLVEVRADSLSTLLGDAVEASFLKIDCEGCEWGFLADPAVARVREIAGEVHRGDGPDEFDRIAELLAATHDVEVDRDRYLFQAVRR